MPDSSLLIRRGLWLTLLSLLLTQFVILCCVQDLNGGVEGSQHEKQLYNMLLHNYSKHCRPVKRDSEPVQVRVAFSLVEVLSIDEDNGQLAVKAWLTMASYSFTFSPALANSARRLIVTI